MNDIVERLIEAVKAERLDEPLVFIFLAEAYLDILYERGDVKCMLPSNRSTTS